jgi:DNA-directed RNA polymerase subunit RPC12/RpoP
MAKVGLKCPYCDSKELRRIVEETIITSYDLDWENEGKGEVESQITIAIKCESCGEEFPPDDDDI